MEANIEQLKFSEEEFEKFKGKNFRDRLKFIDFWVGYIKKTPNKVWSRQQRNLVDRAGK